MRLKGGKSTRRVAVPKGEDGLTLTDLERRFIEAFLTHFDPAKAYEEAGYKTASYGTKRENASKGRGILARSDVAKEIATRLSASVMTREEVLYRLTEQGRNEYAKYIQPNGTVDLASMIADGKTHLIKLIRPGRFGATIEFMDGQRALENLGRYHKLFVDRIEAEGDVTVRVVYEEPLPEDDSLT